MQSAQTALKDADQQWTQMPADYLQLILAGATGCHGKSVFFAGKGCRIENLKEGEQ